MPHLMSSNLTRFIQRFAMILCALFSLSSCAEDDSVGMALSSLNHFTKPFEVVSFSVDEAWGGRIPLGTMGNGSGKSCCVSVPPFKDGMKVRVYWELWDPRADTVGTYVSDVWVEPYDINHTSGLYVHFYDDAKIRVSVFHSRDPQKNVVRNSLDPLLNFPFTPDKLAQGLLIKLEKNVSEVDLSAMIPEDDLKPKGRVRTRRDCCWIKPEYETQYGPSSWKKHRDDTP